MTTENKQDATLRDLLRDKSPSLAAQLDEIEKRGMEDWLSLLQADMGSHAGYPHLHNVEHIANKLIPASLKDDLSSGELFLLLSAVFLHDIGRTTSSDDLIPCGQERGERCEQFDRRVTEVKEEYKPDEHAPCCKPQWYHHQESERIITELAGPLGFPDERIAQYCGLLAFCHNLDKPPDKPQPYFSWENPTRQCKGEEKESPIFRNTSLAPYGSLRIPLLAAIVKLADETDNFWTRAVRRYWWSRLAQETATSPIKAFRRHIEDIEICPSGQCLIAHIGELDEAGTPLGSKDLDSINKARGKMSAVLKGFWGELLRKYGIVFREAYIERAGDLYLRISGDNIAPPLYEVVQKESKDPLKSLLDALMKLALGSYGHDFFSWRSLEAKVGRPLTDLDHWLVQEMGRATGRFRVLTDSDGQPLSIAINMTERAEEADVRKIVMGEKK